MNSIKSIITCSLIVASTQAFSWGGPVMDSYGNRVNTQYGCLHYGNEGSSVCDDNKAMDDMASAPVMAAPAPKPTPVAVTEPAPVVTPEPVAAPAPVVVAPAPMPEKTATAEPAVKNIISLEGVNFETGSAVLTSSSSIKLSEAAQQLLENPDVKVIVAGHTDNRGNADFNMALSQKRAESVKEYLVNKGVNPKNLTARGYGITDPIASNDTAHGRAENRRVELRILK